MNDVVAAQRAVASLVRDEPERAAWRDDPQGWAAAHLDGSAAAMVAGLSPRGVEAMARSYLGKKARFDELHERHHAYEHLKEERARANRHDHAHDHAHDHPHSHEHEPETAS